MRMPESGAAQWGADGGEKVTGCRELSLFRRKQGFRRARELAPVKEKRESGRARVNRLSGEVQAGGSATCHWRAPQRELTFHRA
jgi:hypothetical protein